MSKKHDWDTGFDPYEALLELSHRLLRLEEAHNALAGSYVKTEEHLTSALKAINGIQKAHLTLLRRLGADELTIAEQAIKHEELLKNIPRRIKR